MNFENQIRNSARKYLPASIRKPLGNLCGTFRSRILYPFFGLVFDLKGGRFKADGCVFIIPKNITTFEFRACFLTGAYEADERMLVQKYILPDDGVLELGACLGIVSCVTNKLLRNPLRHLVIEANPYCIPAIHRNRNLNKAGFLVENCAVSNQVEVSFFINPTYITGSTKENSSEVSVRLPGRSLHELTARYGPFSVLIMDIEGSELEILESSLDTLRQFRLVIIELHDWVIGAEGVNRCRAILQQSGFRIVESSFITEAWIRG